MKKDYKNRTIWYFISDYDTPSWGIGMLYYHVHFLNRNGFNAAVLHEHPPFKLTWLDLEVPVSYMEQSGFVPTENDILVIPETAAGDKRVLDLPCRKIVFVQGSFLILLHLKKAYTYRELGYEHAFTYLPHLHKILGRHFDIDLTDTPPFVAPYFYREPESVPATKRKKQIVFFPKPGILDHAIDYDIIIKMLRRKLEKKTGPGLFDKISKRNDNWKIKALENKTHKEVAGLMQESAFFVSTNSREAFNSSVPEAMAAGCIVVCYEAYGPGDFLENNKNAFVFQNNYVYPLVDKLYELIDNYDDIQEDLAEMRKHAYKTACGYRKEKTEKALIDFFTHF